jgi:hypothetical protein
MTTWSLDGKQDDTRKEKMPRTVCPKSEFIHLGVSVTRKPMTFRFRFVSTD